MKQIILKENPIQPGSSNYIHDYLVSLGIPSDKAYIFYQTSRITPKWDGELGDNPNDLTHIEEGAEMLMNALRNNEKIFIQVDSDADGFTSSSIFYNYVKKRFPEAQLTYRLHTGKEHGIIVDTVPEDCQLVVIPDAGSNQIDEIKELTSKGKKVLVLDHHEYDPSVTIEDAVIINSQDPHFTNPALSGAGVVFMFVKKLDEYFNNNYSDFFSDLAALGIISDVMDSKYVGNHLIIYQGLHSIRNKMFRALLMKQEYKISDPSSPTKIEVAFYITPLINGLIRSGSQEEKEAFFAAMLEENSEEIISSTYRGNTRQETIYENAARLAANAKSRQDNAKKKIIATLKKKIEKEGLNEHKLIAVKLSKKESEDINPNITGLAAMDIANQYNKPTIIIRYKEEEGSVHYSGSGRSIPYPGLLSLKDFLESSEMCDFVQGHANAFGVSVPEEKVDDLVKFADEHLANVNFDDKCIEVDYFFKGLISSSMLDTFASQKFLYGNGIDEPKFAFDVEIDAGEFFAQGADSQTLKIRKNGLDFIKFKAGDDIAALKSRPVNNVVIVGTAQINEWMGRRNVQIKIEDMEIQDQKVSILRDLI